jgi:hypothetical protein
MADLGDHHGRMEGTARDDDGMSFVGGDGCDLDLARIDSVTVAERIEARTTRIVASSANSERGRTRSSDA